MKTNKFKLLSIAICCLVAALWPDAQCMDPPIKEDEPIRNHLAEIVPTGSIMAFSGEVAPHGWLLCDGGEWCSREYPELYKVIKTKYVPVHEELRILRHNADEDNKLFYVPDLRGRVIVGVDGGTNRVTNNNKLGESSGEEKHLLTIGEMPSHTHTVEGCRGSANPGCNTSFDVNPSWSVIRDTSSTGGNQPHNNMQPYLVLNYIINCGNTNKKNDEKINQLEKTIFDLKFTLKDLSIKVEKILTPSPKPKNLLGTS